MKSLEERVDRLEMALAHLIDEMADFKKWVLRYIVESDRRVEEYRAQTDRKIEEYKAQVDREIREFKEETNRKIEEYKEETRQRIEEYRVETDRRIEEYRAQVDREIRELKEENRQKIEEYRAETDRKIEEYKAQVDREIREFKEETNRKIEEYRAQVDRGIESYRRETDRRIEEMREDFKKEMREANRRWGEIANKLGTVVEDIIYPALRPVLRKYFGCEPEKTAVRLVYSKKKEGVREEFDAVAVCDDMVFLLEVKSTPREMHIEEFKEKAKRFLRYFPEYAGRRLVLIMGSLSFEEEFVKRLSQEGIYAMAFREWEYMDILNFEEVKDAEKR